MAQVQYRTILYVVTPKQLRAALRSLGLSQRQLAFRLRVTVTTTNRWATGKAPIPESVALLLECWRRDGVPPK